MKADISQFETIQNQHGTAIDNAVHLGAVSDKDDSLLKEIMRATAGIELDTIEFSKAVALAKERIQASDQIDQAIAEPQLEAAIRKVLEENKEQFQNIAKQGKDRLGLETSSIEVPPLNKTPQEIEREKSDPRNFGFRLKRGDMTWDVEDFAQK